MDIREKITVADLKKYHDFIINFNSEASALVREIVKNEFSREEKPDQSFVTSVDFRIEDLLREKVSKLFPTHGIVGEERESINKESEFQWIIDPIDGTQNLVHGIPTYGIVVGLFFQNRPLVGAISHPALHLEYQAAYKLGAYRKAYDQTIERMLIQNRDFSRQEVVALSTRDCFSRSGEESIFDEIMKTHPSTRVYYDVFSTTRVIENQVGLAIEFNMKIWDTAATEILITEAGGKYCSVRDVIRPNQIDMHSIIIGRPLMVDQMYKQLGEYKKITM